MGHADVVPLDASLVEVRYYRDRDCGGLVWKMLADEARDLVRWYRSVCAHVADPLPDVSALRHGNVQISVLGQTVYCRGFGPNGRPRTTGCHMSREAVELLSQALVDDPG
jgi:hypothetical protein